MNTVKQKIHPNRLYYLGMWMCFVLVIILCSKVVASEEDQLEESKALWGSAGLKYGVSMVKMISIATDTEIVKLDRPATTQRDSVEKVLKRYKSTKASMQATATGLAATTQFAVDGTAATMAATGVGVVPAMIVKTAGQLAVDSFNQKLHKDADKAIKGYLSSKRRELESLSGLTYEQLRVKSTQEIKDVLREGTTLLTDLEKMVPGDENVKKLSVDLLINGLKNTQLPALDSIAANQDSLVKLSKNFVEFRNFSFSRTIS